MTEVIWSNAAAFWLLWVLPVVVLLAVFAHQRVRAAARQLVGKVMTPRLLPPLDGGGPARKTALLVAGLALGIVAAARPAWGVFYLSTTARGLDLVVALDVSRSMLADDGADTRLGRARSAVSWLVDELAGDRVGLLLFAGQTVQACPLTLDRGFFRGALRDADPDTVGRGGTKIGPALDQALRMLDTSWDRDKLVLLVTDGGDQESFPKTAAERLRDKKVRVITLGLGRAEPGAPLVLDGKIVRRKGGEPVSARLNDTLLEELAITTDGMYVPPGQAHRLPALYAEHFGHLRRGQNQEVQEKHRYERFQWFLLAAFVLLLAQAGSTAYPRRRGGRGAMAAAALLLCTLPLLGSCGRDRGQVEIAIEQLARGEAEAAEQTLLALGDALADEPVGAYDLACAHQARGRARQARARYVDVLATGDRRLRARTHVNLAMLAADRLRARAGDDPGALAGEARDDLRALAEAALDDLQRARELDQDLARAVRSQDLLARWLRVVESSWRERDRASERAERDQQEGAAYLDALIEAERDLVARLVGGELLEDVELRQRDLLEDLPKAKDHFDDEGATLAEAFRGEVVQGLDDAAPVLQEVAGLLREGRIGEAGIAITRAADELTGPWVLWADPGAGLGAAARQQAGFAQDLQRLTVVRVDDPAQLAVVERARQTLAEREGRIGVWVANLRRRLAPEHAEASWSTVFVERARARLPEVEELLQRVVDRIDVTGPQALLAASRASQALAGLALEWELAGLDAVDLARRLEDEQARLARGTDALRAGGEDVPGVVAALGRVAEGFARSLAWTPLRSDQADQVERARYLDAALQRALTADAPEEPDPEADRQLDERRAQLELLAGGVRDALVRAAAAADDGATPGTVVAMHDARTACRGLWLVLADFETSLGRAAQEQAGLAQRSESVVVVERSEGAQPEHEGATEALARELRDAVREQAVTTALVELLQRGLAAEIQVLEAEVPAALDPDAADAPEPIVEREEREARLAVLRGLGDLLQPAAEAAQQAVDELDANSETFDGLTATFAAAAPPQRRAADLLAQAVEQLAQARLSLVELALRILEGETQLLDAARELIAGRRVQGPDGSELTWEDLRDAQQEAGGYVARLGAALERELAQQQQAQPDPASQTPVDDQAVQALRSLVEGIQGAHAAAVDEPDGEDGARRLRDIETVLDPTRDLWSFLGEFQALLERAVDEQAGLVDRTGEFVGAAPPADRVGGISADQARTARLVPPMRAQLEAMAQQAAQAAAASPQGEPAAGAAPGGLPPEVVELAEKNLPAAEQAMREAQGLLPESSWNDALDRQEEAHRLLEEILEKLREQQDQQDQQDQQQDQQQEQDQQQLSPEELERLLQAVRERNQRQPKHTDRTAVEEDW